MLGLLAASLACTGERGRAKDSFDPTACSLLWYRSRSEGRFDLYKVEMPAADWATGANAYDSGERLGVFYYGLVDADSDGLFESYADAASATSGDFTLTVEGLDEGDSISFSDSTPQSYLGLGDVPIAVGGTGALTGVWSPPGLGEGEDSPEYASGALIAVAYAGSSLSLGTESFGAFGYCWEEPGAGASSLWRPDGFAP